MINRLMLFAVLLCSSFAPALAGGSWGNQVGGSLKRYAMSARFIQLFGHRTFVKAEFYRVYKPAGLGVEHEYLAVRSVWQKDDGPFTEAIYTTGLVARGDDKYFKDILTKDASSLHKVATIDDLERFELIVKRMNKMMREHPANQSCRFTFRMFATPITGQPCTNAVNDLLQLI